MIFLRVLITCLTLLIVTHITLFISLNNEIGNHLNDKITKINSQAVFISFLEIPGLKRKKKYSRLSLTNMNIKRMSLNHINSLISRLLQQISELRKEINDLEAKLKVLKSGLELEKCNNKNKKNKKKHLSKKCQNCENIQKEINNVESKIRKLRLKLNNNKNKLIKAKFRKSRLVSNSNEQEGTEANADTEADKIKYSTGTSTSTSTSTVTTTCITSTSTHKTTTTTTISTTTSNITITPTISSKATPTPTPNPTLSELNNSETNMVNEKLKLLDVKMEEIKKLAMGQRETVQFFFEKLLKVFAASELIKLKCELGMVNKLFVIKLKIIKILQSAQNRNNESYRIDESTFLTTQTEKGKQAIKEYEIILLLLKDLISYFSKLLELCEEIFHVSPKIKGKLEKLLINLNECKVEKFNPLLDLTRFLVQNFSKFPINSRYGSKIFLYLLTRLQGFTQIKECLSIKKLQKWVSLKNEYNNKILKYKLKLKSLKCNGHNHLNKPCTRNTCIIESKKYFLMEKIKTYNLIIELLISLLNSCDNLLKKDPSSLEMQAKIHSFTKECGYTYDITKSIKKLGIYKDLNQSQKKQVYQNMYQLIQTIGGFTFIFYSKDCNIETITELFQFISRINQIKELEENNKDLYEDPNLDEARKLKIISVKSLIKITLDLISFCLTYYQFEEEVTQKIHFNKEIIKKMDINSELRADLKLFENLQILLSEKYIYSTLDCNFKNIMKIIQEKQQSMELLNFYQKELKLKKHLHGKSGNQSIDEIIQKRNILLYEITMNNNHNCSICNSDNVKRNILLEKYYMELLQFILNNCIKIKFPYINKFLDEEISKNNYKMIIGGLFFGIIENLFSEEIILLLNLANKIEMAILNTLLKRFSINMSGLKDCTVKKIIDFKKSLKEIKILQDRLEERINNNNYEEISYKNIKLEEMMNENELMITKRLHYRLKDILIVLILIIEDIIRRCENVIEIIKKDDDNELLTKILKLPSPQYFTTRIIKGLLLNKNEITSVFFELTSNFDLFGHINSCLETNYLSLLLKYGKLSEEFNMILSNFLNKYSNGIDSSLEYNYYEEFLILIGYSLALEYFCEAIYACILRVEGENGLGIIKKYDPFKKEGVNLIVNKSINDILKQERWGYGLFQENLTIDGSHLLHRFIGNDKIKPESCKISFIKELVQKIKEIENLKKGLKNEELIEAKNLSSILSLYLSIIKFCFKFGIFYILKSQLNKKQEIITTGVVGWEFHPTLMEFDFPSYPLEDGFLSNLELFGFDNLVSSGDYSQLFDLESGDLISRTEMSVGMYIDDLVDENERFGFEGFGVGIGIGTETGTKGAETGTETGTETETGTKTGAETETGTKTKEAETGTGAEIKAEVKLEAGDEAKKAEFPILTVMPELGPEQHVLDKLDLKTLMNYNLMNYLEMFIKELSNLLLPEILEKAFKFLTGCDLNLLYLINTRISTIEYLLIQILKFNNNKSDYNSVNYELLFETLRNLVSKLKSYLVKCQELNKFKYPWLHIPNLKNFKENIQSLLFSFFQQDKNIPKDCFLINIEEVKKFISFQKLKIERLENMVEKTKLFIQNRDGKNANFKSSSTIFHLELEKEIIGSAIIRNEQLTAICEEFLNYFQLNSKITIDIFDVLENLFSSLFISDLQISQFNSRISQVFSLGASGAGIGTSPGGNIGPSPSLTPSPGTPTTGAGAVYTPAPAPTPTSAPTPPPAYGEASGFNSPSILLLSDIYTEGTEGPNSPTIQSKPINDISSQTNQENSEYSFFLNDPEVQNLYSLYLSLNEEPLTLIQLIESSGFDKEFLIQMLLSFLEEN